MHINTIHWTKLSWTTWTVLYSVKGDDNYTQSNRMMNYYYYTVIIQKNVHTSQISITDR